QKVEVERKNLEVEQAKQALEEKAEQLALTSKYKSEFLSNMSHELRTPLNSLLILSKQLTDNPEGNLTNKQVEYSRTIHASGNDLLSLINDILDLSKIESGTVTLDLGDVSLVEFRNQMERTFRHVAGDKGLEFVIEIAKTLPATIVTDSKRLQQVLKNLLSNAFKFTEKGKVELSMDYATSGWSADHKNLNRAARVVAFTVTDTGIGIPAEKQKIIFEAFQQADGTTSRKYGGTGLGLAISREIANLLGGELRLIRSVPGQGSTFALFVPISEGGSRAAEKPEAVAPPSEIQNPKPESGSEVRLSQTAIADDRAFIAEGDHVLLIVEDDINFAGILLETAHAKGFKCVVATRGDAAFKLVREFKPHAITLDLLLPDVDGWTLLDRFKKDPETRHIPVHIISVESARELGLKRGAFAFLEKPVSKAMLDESFARLLSFVEAKQRDLLIVEDDDTERQRIVELIGNGDVRVTAVGAADEALTALKRQHFDCMVLDLRLPGKSGLELLEEMQKEGSLRDLPVIVYTGKDLTKKEETQLEKWTKRTVMKDVRSPERLLDETALFLHRVTANLPESKQQMIQRLYQADTALTGKKILIVDDDIRNIFALTTVLERHNIEIFSAENGKMAIDLLQKTSGIDAALMDIMMPEMDGYETMRAIRKLGKFKNLPIIALTAKAMKGDREKCIEAGASDYIAKPVDTEQLLSLLRVWLYR
ncbi:MAG: response regulator, partial [Chloroflexota bacterium]|nr:response regulator [Chloroflexota bacterium]